ncbi:EF-hand domain-containing protein [Paracoccus sp. ME4]|uniref:EF-hand domain-containing protein n=1 Tax=Paracoccus sp. ME4 TaxID=3138066 RepID=UPI00398B0BDC
MRLSILLQAAGVAGLLSQAAHASGLPAFEQLDINRDGITTEAEIRDWIGALHAGLDTDGDGRLSVREITAGGHDAATAEAIVSNNDLDRSGHLSVDELSMLLPVLFGMADKNRDAILERAEYDAALSTLPRR